MSRKLISRVVGSGAGRQLTQGHVVCAIPGSYYRLKTRTACPATTMSDYDLRPGGSLKLKGTVADGGIVKK